MADVYAIANGNWSDPAIWSGSTVPGTADNVWLNGKTITLDQDISVASLSSEANATLGTVAGGTLDIPSTYSTRSITASGDIRHGGTTNMITFTAATQIVLSASAIYSSSNSGGTVLRCTSTSGTFIVTAQANLVARVANVVGSAGAAINISITGDVYSIGNGYVLYAYGLSGTFTINGNAKNGTFEGDAAFSGIVNGNVLTESSLAAKQAFWFFGGNNQSLQVNGNVICGPYPCIVNNKGLDPSPFALTINGAVYGSPAVNIGAVECRFFRSGSSVRINGDVYSGAANGACAISVSRTESSGSLFINGNMRVQVGGSNSVPAVCSPTLIISNAQTRYIEHWEGDIGTGQPTGNKLIFETNINASQANPADVRQGVVYGPAGEYTGTCAVPPPQAVAYGVPVDNTIGQAGLPPYRAVAEYRGG
ncbi:MAG: hypothetical protein KatS3mg087_2061 [Patescibacteria group bacterium]|nr:MAG: hypothetical protein KatS3mg087_2061 [Patescibacteria group bacterium]